MCIHLGVLSQGENTGTHLEDLQDEEAGPLNDRPALSISDSVPERSAETESVFSDIEHWHSSWPLGASLQWALMMLLIN